MAQFRGKVAVVTGGTSGIGRSAAVAFAREGAKVVVAGRRQAEGEETVREVRAADGDGIFVATDVTKEDDVRRLVAVTLQKYGRLDFLFSNAGVEQTPTPLVKQTEDEYRQVIDVSVRTSAGRQAPSGDAEERRWGSGEHLLGRGCDWGSRHTAVHQRSTRSSI
jgi:NAD(P)-dependent dehydrogenase (short-subunit alcohol dehydrogenase family)